MKHLKAGTQVKFTPARISELDDVSAARYRERVGKVVGYRPGGQHPSVEFPADAEHRPEVLQDVALCHLEVFPN